MTNGNEHAPSSLPITSRKGRPTSDETHLRKQAVLDAAQVEFCKRSFVGAKMDDIAARAGVSKRSLYLWYVNKAALFKATIVHGTLQLDLPELAPSLDVRSGLLKFGVALTAGISNEQALQMTRLLFREAPESEEVRHAIDESRRMVCYPLVNFLTAKGIAPPKATTLAEMLMTLLLARCHDAAIHKKPPPTTNESRRHVVMVVELTEPGLRNWMDGIGEDALPSGVAVAATGPIPAFEKP